MKNKQEEEISQRPKKRVKGDGVLSAFEIFCNNNKNVSCLIFRYLPLKDIFSGVLKTCKILRKICFSSPILWRSVCLQIPCFMMGPASQILPIARDKKKVNWSIFTFLEYLVDNGISKASFPF